MSHTEITQSEGPRFLVNLPVRAEWDEESTGRHVIAEGTTENIGPAGAMVTFAQLPAVGTRIRISVPGVGGSDIETVAEVVRLVRDLRQPLASLSILKAKKEWRGMVWEPARIQATETTSSKDDQERQ